MYSEPSDAAGAPGGVLWWWAPHEPRHAKGCDRRDRRRFPVTALTRTLHLLPPSAMFSSPSAQTAAPQRRNVASTVLRGAGLTRTDDDVSMRDAAGGVKRSARNHRPHERPTRAKRLEKMEVDAGAAAKERSTVILPFAARFYPLFSPLAPHTPRLQ